MLLQPDGNFPDVQMNKLPWLVYVSREKRPKHNHNKKAGAMNALVRASGVITNAPYILNLDCDHYVNYAKAFKEVRTAGSKRVVHFRTGTLISLLCRYHVAYLCLPSWCQPRC